jgi:hypothetical protein
LDSTAERVSFTAAFARPPSLRNAEEVRGWLCFARGEEVVLVEVADLLERAYMRGCP